MGAQPVPKLGLLVSELGETGEQQRAVQRRDTFVRLRAGSAAVRMKARSAPTSMCAERCASCSAERMADGEAAPSKSSHSLAAMT